MKQNVMNQTSGLPIEVKPDSLDNRVHRCIFQCAQKIIHLIKEAPNEDNRH